jgi:hypothetical protein
VGKAKLGPLFLDTSIQIARFVHSRATKVRIKARVAEHERTETGLVVRQEFKRRLLHEAEYLLRLLQRYRSYDEVRHHLIRLPPVALRKRNICEQMLTQIHGGTDKDLTDRLKLYLHSLLVTGLRRFDQQVDLLREESGCACARAGVVAKAPPRNYDLGQTRCSHPRAGTCRVVNFLIERKTARAQLVAYLKAIPEEEKTAELKKAQQFLESLETRLEQARQLDPCLQVGDLLIGLESVNAPNFYTLNSGESQHLCRALGQTLIVRPADPLHEDVVCPREAPAWPAFGKKAARPKNDGGKGIPS